jgi:hypothetical protein
LTASSSDFTPTPTEFNAGSPRVAGFWTDLDSQPTAGGTVKSTVDNNPGPGLVPYVQIDYNQVESWISSQSHTFSMLLRADGYLEIIHATTNNASLYDTIVGIGPGLNQSTAAQKNFVGPQLGGAGAALGPGILTTSPFQYIGAVNESFFEWFGLLSQHAPPTGFYTNGYDNPYDLYATTLHFLATGTGPLPSASNRYTLY